MHDIKETMEVINYKICIYYHKCESATNEVVSLWNASKKKK
ncbi:hypothetical protein [Clostridium sp.]|nr:hypothetical protein [Clostridium sp.]MDR3594375.1 hypothetical protein [Clostridium sp.]